MDESVPKAGFLNRLGQRARRMLNPSAFSAEIDAEIERLRKKTPAPVFWLFGKTQSGKTSIIRYLTQADDAEIGNGFRPCTRTSRMYPFPIPEAPILTFLDTRGVDEAGYEPAEDIAACDGLAHVMVVTQRITDFASGSLREALKAIRKVNATRPVILALTCLHEAYPQQQHPQPYTPTPGGEVGRLIATQSEQYAGLVDRVIPIDFTRREEGYEESNYGGELLKQTLLEVLPHAYRETLIRYSEGNVSLQELHTRRAMPVIEGHSMLAASAGAIPIPIVDLFILPSIQTKMIHALAKISGQPTRGQEFYEYAASVGLGVLTRSAVRQVVKFVPYLGSIAGAALAYGSTYALGKAFLEYDRSIRAGHAPSTDAIKKLYEQEIKAAESAWKAHES